MRLRKRKSSIPKRKRATPKPLAELEAEAREKVKRYKDWFHELDKLERADRLADYVNSSWLR